MKTTAARKPPTAPSPRRRRPDRTTDAPPAVHRESDELSNGELAELVRETFRCEVGPALDSIRVGCLNGLVLLSGVVASDELRQVAEQIVRDEMGLDMVDRVAVSPLAAESSVYRRRPYYAADYARELGLGSPAAIPLSAYDVEDVPERYAAPPDRPVPEWE